MQIRLFRYCGFVTERLRCTYEEEGSSIRSNPFVGKNCRKGCVFLAVKVRSTVMVGILMVAMLAVALSFSAREAQAGTGDRVVREARTWIGVPYRWGGESRRGTDCSGFTRAVYKKFGRRLPDSPARQMRYGRRVTKPRAGDLVFFNERGRGISHVGIATGRGTRDPRFRSLGQGDRDQDTVYPWLRGRP